MNVFSPPFDKIDLTGWEETAQGIARLTKMGNLVEITAESDSDTGTWYFASYYDKTDEGYYGALSGLLEEANSYAETRGGWSSESYTTPKVKELSHKEVVSKITEQLNSWEGADLENLWNDYFGKNLRYCGDSIFELEV